MDAPSWHKFFRAANVYKFQIASQNQSRALLIENTEGTFQLYAYSIDSDKKTKIGTYEHGQIFGTISADGSEIYAPKSMDGSEGGHMYAYSFDGSSQVDLTPDMEPYTSFEVIPSSHSSRICFFASFKDKTCVIALDRNNDTPASIIFSTNGEMGFPPIALSSDGELCAVSHSITAGNKTTWQLQVIEVCTKRNLFTKEFEGGHVYPLALVKEPKGSLRLLTQTNRRGYEEPMWLFIESGEMIFLQSIPLCDVYPMSFHEESSQILMCSVSRGAHTLFLSRDSVQESIKIGPSYGSFDMYYGGAQFLNENIVIFRHQSSRESAKVIFLNIPNGVYKTYYACPKEVSVVGAPYSSIECTTSDGTMIQAWISLPNGDNNTAPVPFIIDLHGGPDAVLLDSFSPEAQAWIDNGFGYCGLNYRGSVTFGREYQNKIIGKPGTCEVEDCVAIKKELVARGFAHPQKVFLTGYSWGGFVTLLGLGKTPSEWAAGIALMPIADWVLDFRLIPNYLQALNTKLFTGTPEEVPEIYRIASPITYTPQLRAPVLMLAGMNDTRCPIEQVVSYVEAADMYGKDVTLEKINGGHLGSFGNAELGIAMYTKIFDFVHKKTLLDTEVEKGRS